MIADPDVLPIHLHASIDVRVLSNVVGICVILLSRERICQGTKLMLFLIRLESHLLEVFHVLSLHHEQELIVTTGISFLALTKNPPCENA